MYRLTLFNGCVLFFATYKEAMVYYAEYLASLRN